MDTRLISVSEWVTPAIGGKGCGSQQVKIQNGGGNMPDGRPLVSGVHHSISMLPPEGKKMMLLPRSGADECVMLGEASRAVFSGRWKLNSCCFIHSKEILHLDNLKGKKKEVAQHLLISARTRS